MLSKENQLKVAGLSAVLATTLGLGGALVAPATALAVDDTTTTNKNTLQNPEIQVKKEEGNLTIGEVEENDNDNKKTEHNADELKVVEVVRLYNPWNGDHLFTSDTKEVFNAEKAGWTNEGTFWKAYGHEGDYRLHVNKDKKLGTPVLRLFNQYTGEHLYTTSTEEYNARVANGWTGEGVSFYSVAANEDGTPKTAETSDKVVVKNKVDSVYRMFNPFVQVGTHLYGGVEENAKCLADGWKADNVVDGKQKPMFGVFDLDHTADEAKIAQALARIEKEYKANLEKYKGLEKELLDATMSGSKYDKEAEKKKITDVQEVTKALTQELKDVQFYLNKLKFKADQIINNTKGKHGAHRSDAFALASEVVFQKENYKAQKEEVAKAEGALASAQAELAKAKLEQALAQIKLDAYKANELKAAEKQLDDLKKALAKETEKAKQDEIKTKIDELKKETGAFGKAEKAFKGLQDELSGKADATKTAQETADKAATDLKKAKEDLAAFKLHFSENVKKFNDFRHTLKLSEAQALRDVAAYNKYALEFTNINTAATTLANKEAALFNFIDAGTNVQTYNDTVDAELKAVKSGDRKLPDYSKVKQAVKDVLDPFFIELEAEVDEMPF